MLPPRPARTPCGWGARRGLVADPGEAKPYVSRRAFQGVDYVKIIVDLPGLEAGPRSWRIVEAAYEQGHRTIAFAAARDAVLLAQAAKRRRALPRGH